jgi:hypothetical protein
MCVNNRVSHILKLQEPWTDVPCLEKEQTPMGLQTLELAPVLIKTGTAKEPA